MEGLQMLLGNLPSRGFLVNPDAGVFYLRPKTYIADHSTSPPDDQIIKTDPANILIRALQLKKSKAEKEKEQVRKAAKGKAADKNKRSAEEPLEGPSHKRQNAGSVAGPSGEPSAAERAGGRAAPKTLKYTLAQLQAKTVKSLQDILKSKSLHVSGRKDELIQRIQDHQERERRASRPTGR